MCDIKWYRVCITTGDWEGNGHGLTDKFFIESNLSPEQIYWAYERAVEITGVDLVTEICDYPRDYLFPPDVVAIWKDCGIINHGIEYPYGATPGEFVDVWLGYIWLGDSTFRYRLVDNDMGYFNVGGYGLYVT